MAGSGSQAVVRVGLLALAAVPLPMVAVLRAEAREHPVLALVLAVGYWFLLLIVAFAAKVFGELQTRWATRVADRVDRVVRGRLSQFERRYRRYLAEIHRFTDLKGLATRGEHTPALAEVFVDVSLVPSPAHELDRSPLVGTISADTVRRSMDELLDQPRAAVLAVIGKPGTGKTTLLEHTAVRLAGPAAKQARRRDLPILLFLRDHASAVVDSPRVSLPDRVRATMPELAADEPPGWLNDQLAKGRCVVMLDGLDEVAQADDRRLLVTWVEQQIAQYPGNDWVLTSRPQGYESSPLNRAQVLRVRRFTSEQITRFLHRWYLAVERISTGVADDDEGVRRRALSEADDLLRRLKDRPMLYDLAANPLLLTMIANVHRYRGALPGSRAELYAEICQVLLWRRREAKRLRAPDGEITGAQQEMVLRELAYTMMTEQTRDLPEADAEPLLRPAFARVGFTGSAQDFLEPIVDSGLILERELGLFAFAHHTFQEHLAAAHIRDHDLTDTLTAAVEDPWWRETTLLWAARSDPGPVIDACLDNGGVPALTLAFDCLEEAAVVSPAARERLEEFLAQALQAAPGSTTLRLMTGVTVARHLREVVSLPGDVFLCCQPISDHLFELFLGDPSRPSPRETSGISAAMARDFLHWVNDLDLGGVRYRLPLASELADPAARTVIGQDRTIWTSGQGAAHGTPSKVFVPDGVLHPWAATPERIRQALLEGSDHLRVGILVWELGQVREELLHLPSDAFLATTGRRHLNELTSLITTPFHGGQDLAYLLNQARSLVTQMELGGRLDPASHRVLRGINQCLELGRAVHPQSAAHIGSQRPVLQLYGRALTVAQRFLLGGRSGDREDEWLVQCIRAVGSGPFAYSLWPENLPHMLRGLPPMLASDGETAENDQGGESDIQLLAAELAALASVLEQRPERMAAPEIAQCLRIGVLTLARVAEGDSATHLCRQVAAGFTVLQDRAEGTQPRNETLYLIRA